VRLKVLRDCNHSQCTDRIICKCTNKFRNPPPFNNPSYFSLTSDSPTIKRLSRTVYKTVTNMRVIIITILQSHPSTEAITLYFTTTAACNLRVFYGICYTLNPHFSCVCPMSMFFGGRGGGTEKLLHSDITSISVTDQMHV
jgi:hypothetical protein